MIDLLVVSDSLAPDSISTTFPPRCLAKVDILCGLFLFLFFVMLKFSWISCLKKAIYFSL